MGYQHECMNGHPVTASLVDDNRHFLRQLAGLVGELDAERFRACSGPYGGNGIGRQVRHILEHVQSLLAGARGELDYDDRDRDPVLERDPDRALETLARLDDRLGQELAALAPDTPLRVACVCNTASGPHRTWTPSSLQRELMFLISHTVHHMALIAMLAEEAGLRPGEEFGVAPSTLRHWRAKPSFAVPASAG
ncbi:DinB family protein [Alkalispirillum mobile]|uniref:DinB family protein n=2 Tax=Alkalispirillum mobile TaxID=85925 RepID=A0A498C6I5_9GAMM|nr:DinB family protein [Alkalispirillum mobile]